MIRILPFLLSLAIAANAVAATKFSVVEASIPEMQAALREKRVMSRECRSPMQTSARPDVGKSKS